MVVQMIAQIVYDLIIGILGSYLKDQITSR